MTMTDEQWAAAELERRWPGKFNDDELRDLAPRLSRYHRDDAERAMEGHKASNRFKPTWAELLGKLNVLVRSNAAAAPRQPPPERSYPDLWAEHYRDAPAIAVLVYWRAQWRRYAEDARDRNRGLTGPALRTARVEWNGWATKAVRGAVSGLIAAGGCPHWAKTAGKLVTDIGPAFDRGVADIRANGVRQPATRQRARAVDEQAVFAADVFQFVPPLEKPAEQDRQRKALAKYEPPPEVAARIAAHKRTRDEQLAELDGAGVEVGT